MRYLLDAIYLLILAVIAVLAIPFRRFRQEFSHLITRRFWGSSLPALDGRPTVWMHAVSIGEALACRPLLLRLGEIRRDLQFVLSVGTSDGMAVALREMPEVAIFYAPLDFSWSVRRVFYELRPTALVIAENDFWPNMLNEALRCDVPLAIFNSRMSVREQNEHRWNAWILRPGLQRATWWGAVTEPDADWIRQFFRVEPPQLEITGSLKFDGIVRSPDNPRTNQLRQQCGICPLDRVLVAGSTHQLEEELLVDVANRLSTEFPQFRLVLAPRIPSRCGGIAKMLQRKGVDFVLTSDLTNDSKSSAFVTLIDRVGVLRTAWGLAEFAFVGGSLAEHGGQNMIEPASYGIPVCFGPHIWNFQSVAAEFLATGSATQLSSAEELEKTIRYWLANPREAKQIGIRGQELVKSQTRALEQTVQGILSILPRPKCCVTMNRQILGDDVAVLQTTEVP